MPTIFRLDGYRFFFYSNEGDPREAVHVHVMKDGAEAKFWVRPVALARSTGFDARSLRHLASLVEANAHRIEEAWHDHFRN